jgi:hypothetical protein
MAFAGENPPVSPFFKGGRLQRWEAEKKNLKSAFEKIRFSVPLFGKACPEQSRREG